MPYASEKRQAITAIFIVFLFIFSEIIVTENNYQEELDLPVSSHSIFLILPTLNFTFLLNFQTQTLQHHRTI